MAEQDFHIQYLQGEFSRRQASNDSYSLRAFARALEVDPSTLSKVLSGRRRISPKQATRILEKLQPTDDDGRNFLHSVASSVLKKDGEPRSCKETQIAQDEFQIMGKLIHFIILEMTFLKGFSAKPHIIARKLGVTTIEVEEAIARLIRVGLLKKVDGTLVKTSERITTADKNQTTAPLKEHQDEILRRARSSLRNDDLRMRSMTGMTMAIAPEKLTTAKIMIQDFMNKLCDFLEDGEQTKVYQLGISLFPVSK